MQDNVVIFPQPLPGERTPHSGIIFLHHLLPWLAMSWTLPQSVRSSHVQRGDWSRLRGGRRWKSAPGPLYRGIPGRGAPDGVYFVPLAAIRDPGLVLSTLAELLGLRPGKSPALLELLSLARHEKHSFFSAEVAWCEQSKMI